MEMCYDGALVMPSNYAVMSEDEMTYVHGGKSATANFANIGVAQSYFANLGARYRVIAVAAGMSCTVSGIALGAIGGVYGGIAGGIAGAIGGWVCGSVIYGWGTTYSDIAYDLSKYKKKNRKCSVTVSSSGVQLRYSIKVK